MSILFVFSYQIKFDVSCIEFLNTTFDFHFVALYVIETWFDYFLELLTRFEGFDEAIEL